VEGEADKVGVLICDSIIKRLRRLERCERRVGSEIEGGREDVEGEARSVYED
jgi:hypothetical protein